MNAAGINVSKGKIIVSILRPLGKVVAKPFEVHHASNKLTSIRTALKNSLIATTDIAHSEKITKSI